MTRRAALALGAAVAAGLAGLGTAGPAVAGDDPDPTAPDRLTLVAQTPWVAPDGTFDLRVGVAAPEPGATVTVSVHDRAPNRTRFLASLGGEGVRSQLTTAEAPIAGGEATLSLEGASLPREGVYPVIVELVDADGELADRLVTHLLRLDQPDPAVFPLGVALIVPIHAAPAHLVPGEVSAGPLRAIPATVEAVRAHPDLALNLVPTPETIDSLAAVDAASVAGLARAIRQSQLVGGPWVRVDPGSWARADFPTSDIDTAGTEALETHLGSGGDRSTWIAPEDVSRQSVVAADDAGAESVVVDGTALEPPDADDFPITLTRPFEIALDAPSEDGEDEGDGEPATVPGLAADVTLAAHHDETDDPVLAAHRTLADLAVLALDDPSERRVAVLRLDTDAAADAPFLEALLAGLEPPPPPEPSAPTDPTSPTTPPAAGPVSPTPLVVAETLGSAFAAVTPAGADGGADAEDPLVRTLVDDSAPPTLGTLPTQLRAADERLTSYRTVFGPADAVGEDVEVVHLTAASSDLDEGERRLMLDGTARALDEPMGGITGPPNQRVTFTDRTGVVQLLLGNATGRPADVALRVRSDRLELPDYENGIVPVRLVEPVTRFDLRVRARTSGDAPLDVVLTSPDGRIVLGASRITVRSTAVSGVGLVLMGTAAGFLLVWWSRTIIRERRARHRPPAHRRQDQ